MAKRRPSGDGMVRKREDGRWEGRIVVGHKENGEVNFIGCFVFTLVLCNCLSVRTKIFIGKVVGQYERIQVQKL